MNVYVLDIAPLRSREREALALLPEERREKALRIRREEARLRSIGASLLLRAAGLEPPAVICVGRAVLLRQMLDWQGLAAGATPRSLDPLQRGHTAEAS